MKQNLLPSLKTLWPLLSLTLFFQTACDSNQIIAQKGTKDTKPVDQKEIKSPFTSTVALAFEGLIKDTKPVDQTFEELIEEFKQQGFSKTGEDKANHEEVLKALEEVKDDKSKIEEKISVEISAANNMEKTSVLFGALATGASAQLLQALAERGADINENFENWEDRSLLTVSLVLMPFQSIKWLIEKGAKVKNQVKNHWWTLWDNKNLTKENRKELLVSLIKNKVLDIEAKTEDGDNFLGCIGHIMPPFNSTADQDKIIKDRKKEAITILLSEDLESTGIRELLYIENNEKEIPYEIALDAVKWGTSEEIAELFKNAMDPDRYTIKVSGERGRKISDVLRQ